MAKKKTEESKQLDFSDKTIPDVYEGLVCLDIKLSKLIDILEPVAKYIEDKRNGTLTIQEGTWLKVMHKINRI